MSSRAGATDYRWVRLGPTGMLLGAVASERSALREDAKRDGAAGNPRIALRCAESVAGWGQKTCSGRPFSANPKPPADCVGRPDRATAGEYQPPR